MFKHEWLDACRHIRVSALCVLTRVGKKYFSAELTDFQVKDNVIAYTFLTCFFLFFWTQHVTSMKYS